VVGERLVIDFEACEIFPATTFLGRVARAVPERVLFECWSSVANRVRWVDLVVDGDFTLACPASLVTTPALDAPVVLL
jgi:hypothetical protein